MTDTLDTLLHQAERNLAQAERLHARKKRAAERSPVMPAMTDGPQITVSIAWINWMIEFFEGGPYDPPSPELDPAVATRLDTVSRT